MSGHDSQYVDAGSAMLSDTLHSESRTSRPLRFGIVLLPNFTLTAFSGFVDLLRLASDEGDMSRPVRCS